MTSAGRLSADISARFRQSFAGKAEALGNPAEKKGRKVSYEKDRTRLVVFRPYNDFYCTTVTTLPSSARTKDAASGANLTL